MFGPYNYENDYVVVIVTMVFNFRMLAEKDRCEGLGGWGYKLG